MCAISPLCSLSSFLYLAALASMVGVDSLYPDDAYSRPASDRLGIFETGCGVYLGPGHAWDRARDFEYAELLPIDHGGRPATEWRFKLRKGATAGSALAFHHTIRRRPDAISFRVANRSEAPVRLSMLLIEVQWEPKAKDGALWDLPCPQAVAPGGETELTFPVASGVPAKPADHATPLFPAVFQVRIGEIRAGAAHDLLLSDLTIHYPHAPCIETARLDGPAALRPGDSARFEIECRGDTAGHRLDIEVRDEPRVLWRIRLDSGESRELAKTGQCVVVRPVPLYLPNRKLTAWLVADGYRAAGKELKVESVNEAHPKLPRMEVHMHNGRPTVFHDNDPFAWNGYASYSWQPGNVSEFGASGANVFVIPTDAGQHIHQIVEPTWVGPDEYDFSQLDEGVAMAFQANPDASIVLRVSLALPPFWVASHNVERALVRVHENDFPWWETGTEAVSIASKAWREQQEVCLRKLIDYCKEQPWADRLIAVMPTCEVTEEWFSWACNDGLCSDYSQPHQRAFQSYCKAHGLDIDAIPGPDARTPARRDLYASEAVGRASAAYAQFNSDFTADVIAHFAHVVKDATGGRCLVGAFYGYVVQLAGEPRQHLAGHFAVRRLIDEPDFDFFAGIPLHNFRDLTNGYDLYTSATESILAAGKLVLNENDLFSWLHQGLWYREYNPEDPRAGAISMHQRVFANDAVHGALRQWFSLFSSWHHDAGLQKTFSELIDLQEQSLCLDRTPVEEIAFLVDDTSFAWYPPGTALPRIAHCDWLYTWGRTGAPAGVWLLSDVDKLPDRIKVIVLAGAPAAHPSDIVKLQRIIEKGGRTIILQGPVGLVNPLTQQWDPEAPAALTGLPLTVSDQSATGCARLTPGGPQISDVPALCPRVTAKAEGWMTYDDGACAGVERPLTNGGRLIWCGVPPLDSALMRQWAEQAGVHCYAPLGFTIHAAAQLVSITAPDRGAFPLAWERPVRAVDLLDSWTGQGEEMVCPFEPGQTRLLRVEQ